MASETEGTRTSPILKRNRANRNQGLRLAQMKTGPGTFVYDGGHCVVEHEPTIKLVGKKEPVFDSDGAPMVDAQGRLIYKKAGRPALTPEGRPILGGVPKAKRIELSTYKLRGVEFPKGVPVDVDDEDLALKLRCLGAVREIEEGEAAAPKKRGRPRKVEAEAVEGDEAE